ncbi:unnamed protein product [marine sediment metagenome]|uniref:Uncharacterized protein n=1 Tax=marine sediment metagenome TaxID=412755 RepID=X0UKB9_9ZZZZ
MAGAVVAKSMGLEKVKYFDPKRLKNIAVRHVTKMYKRVVDQGKDARGKGFKGYTPEYQKLKDRRFKKKDGQSYKNVPVFASENKREDFVLRGKTMFNLRERGVGKDYYNIGWEGEAAAIVEGNASRGRDIINSIPDDEFVWVTKELGIAIEREWKKLKNVVITVGK